MHGKGVLYSNSIKRNVMNKPRTDTGHTDILIWILILKQHNKQGTITASVICIYIAACSRKTKYRVFLKCMASL
jgi:hypothetical protein